MFYVVLLIITMTSFTALRIFKPLKKIYCCYALDTEKYYELLCMWKSLFPYTTFQTMHTHTYTLSSPPTVTMHSEQPRGLKFASIASPCCGWLSGMLLHSLTISRTNGSFSICSRKQLESNPETHSADITSFMWTCRRGQKGEKKWRMQNTVFRIHMLQLDGKLKLLIDHQRAKYQCQYCLTIAYWPLSFLLPKAE